MGSQYVQVTTFQQILSEEKIPRGYLTRMKCLECGMYNTHITNEQFEHYELDIGDKHGKDSESGTEL
jgi:hypothetical protein